MDSIKTNDDYAVIVDDGSHRFLSFLCCHRWIFGLLLVVATFLAYSPVWHAGFIFDDNDYIIHNSLLISSDGLKRIWLTPGATIQYYPLTFTVFWLQYHLWGLNPLGYHLVNVSLHACNAILFWVTLRSLGVRDAWLAAGFFALHPVCVESVAWVTELKNTLSGLFYLTAILAALKFWLPKEIVSEARLMESESAHRTNYGRWRFYWLALFLYVCALCSKTTTLPLPVIILLLVWWKRGRIVWSDIYPMGLFLAIGFLMGFVTMHVEQHLGASANVWKGSWLQRCLLAGQAIWFYLYKLVWPHILIPIYPRMEISTTVWTAYIPALTLAGGLLILWRERNNRGRAPLVALLYFIALLFLMLGFFNMTYFRYSFVASHFQYLANLGPLALLAPMIMTALGPSGRRILIVKIAFGCLLLLTLFILTWKQCWTFVDDETFCRTTISLNPSCWLAHNNLANDLLERGQVNESIFQSKEAISIDPTFVQSHYTLGAAFLQKNQLDEAIIQFQEVLIIQPYITNAHVAFTHYNLGIAFIKKNQLANAKSEFEKVLAINPEFSSAHYNLGNILLRKGDTNGAVEHFQKALSLQPKFTKAYIGLGNIFLQKEQLDDAAIQFKDALEIDPNNADACDGLGNAFLQKGELANAILQYKHALTINPSLLEAKIGLIKIVWALATSLKSSARNGINAIELAQLTAQLSDNYNPIVVGTLAAAFGEGGRFPEAIKTVKHAIDLATGQTNIALANDLQIQLKLYQAGLSSRQTKATCLDSNSIDYK